MKTSISRLVLGLLPCAMFLLTPSARASIIVVTNLNQSIGSQTVSPYIGQAFVTGPSTSIFLSAALSLAYTPVAPLLEVEATNPDGTVGSTLFVTTAESLNAGLLTFTPSTAFTFAANTDYFLVLSDPNAALVQWNYTFSPSYTAASGFSIPANDAAFQSYADNTVVGPSSQYYTLASGPELFSLSVTSAPEPATLLYMLPFVATALFIRRKQTPAGV